MGNALYKEGAAASDCPSGTEANNGLCVKAGSGAWLGSDGSADETTDTDPHGDTSNNGNTDQ